MKSRLLGSWKKSNLLSIACISSHNPNEDNDLRIYFHFTRPPKMVCEKQRKKSLIKTKQLEYNH